MTPQQPYFPHPSHNLPTIWRSSSQLVMTKNALLPTRCVKCNAPADELLKRKLTWHHPALYLLVLVSVLVYAIVAMVLRKTAIVNLGLCEDHSAARRQDIAVTWILGLMSLVGFAVAIVIGDANFVIVGGLLLLGTAFYGTIKLRVVSPAKIDDHFVWLKGVNAGYLQQFPEWRGTR